ncbi:MAG TPA: hypothetical protein VHT24_10715, partial [Pseudacidobacterium sp.]|nr:hypothetical protein [Pseudacidobacterium sp.]
LEIRLKELAAVEMKVQSLQEAQKASRQRIFQELTRVGLSDWREGVKTMELVSSQEFALQSTFQEKRAEVASAKTLYLERRKERRQVESVIEKRQVRASLEHSRKEQRMIDDWFGQRNRLKNNGSRPV